MKTPQPVLPYCVWNQAAQFQKGELSHLYLYGKVSLEMQTPKLLWLKKNKPEVWDGAQDFFDLADFLTFKVNIAIQSNSHTSLDT